MDEVKVGSQVLYADHYGKLHVALLTAVWGDGKGRVVKHVNDEGKALEDIPFNERPADMDYTQFKATPIEGTEGQEWPSVNLVFVSGDEAKDDQYGRQIERDTFIGCLADAIERDTSVVHRMNQSAHGNYWTQI